MFSNRLCFILLSIYFSSFAAQAAPQFGGFRGGFDRDRFCNGQGQQEVVTVTEVVTSTVGASAPAETNAANNNGNNGGANGNNGNNNQGGNNNDDEGDDNNNNNNGGNNNNNNGGNNNNNNNGGGNNNGGNNNGGNNNGGNNNNNGGGNNNGGNNNGNNNGGNNGGNNNGGNGGADPQTSLTLDPSVIAQGFANDGQDDPVDGQSPSLTSTNNFINFCVGDVITDGKQIREGSCNPAPIGKIPSTDNMPSSKFVFPQNGDRSIQTNSAFTIQMKIRRMQTGFFVNAQANYFAAPQQLNGQGQIIGHTHVVVELMSSLDQTQPPDPNVFAFFKGVNTPADGQDIVTADVADGLPAGIYRLTSINAASNHQPLIVPVAQHGHLDDAIYFEVSDNPSDDSLFAPANAGNDNNDQDEEEQDEADNEDQQDEEAANEDEDEEAANEDEEAGNEDEDEEAANENGNENEEAAEDDQEELAEEEDAAQGDDEEEAAQGGDNEEAAEDEDEEQAAEDDQEEAAEEDDQEEAAEEDDQDEAAEEEDNAAGENLQTFTGDLGGSLPPAVTAGGRGFVVGNNDFLNLPAALSRSCDIQKNQCADTANASRNAGFNVGDCDAQNGECKALIQ